MSVRIITTKIKLFCNLCKVVKKNVAGEEFKPVRTGNEREGKVLTSRKTQVAKRTSPQRHNQFRGKPPGCVARCSINVPFSQTGGEKNVRSLTL